MLQALQINSSQGYNKGERLQERGKQYSQPNLELVPVQSVKGHDTNLATPPPSLFSAGP